MPGAPLYFAHSRANLEGTLIDVAPTPLPRAHRRTTRGRNRTLMRIGFDCDGVLSYTPFGRLAVHAPSPVPDLPSGYEDLYRLSAPGGRVRAVLAHLRFAWRPLTHDASAVVRSLAA